MTTAIILGVYAVVGAAACVFAVVSRRANGVTAVLLVPLWPFLVPGLFQMEDAGDPLAGLGDRERRAIDGLLAHLRERRRRLEAVARARPTAPDRVRARLDALAEQLQRELKTGQALLEEVTAQLTLVRLSGAGEADRHAADRLHVEALVASLEAIVHEAGRGPVEGASDRVHKVHTGTEVA